MTKGEFSEIWHDWLRGVAMVGGAGLLTGLYFLKWIPHDVFPLVMGVAAIIGVLGFVLEHCLCTLVPTWMRLATLLLVLGSGAGLLIAVHVGVSPGSVVAQGKLSPSHPTLEGYIPATGDVLLDVTGTPGVMASKEDSRIVARLKVTYRTEESPGADVEQVLKWTFATTSDSKKGGASATSLQAHLENGIEGKFAVQLEELVPRHATPLDVRASFAMFPAWALRIVLASLALMALLLSPLYARKGTFPSFLPGTMVLGAAGFATLYGLPPASPEPKLLGILVASAFGGAVVGYVLGKLVQRLFPSPQDLLMQAQKGKSSASARVKAKG